MWVPLRVSSVFRCHHREGKYESWSLKDASYGGMVHTHHWKTVISRVHQLLPPFHYSRGAAPQTRLTSIKTPFKWNVSAETAFHDLFWITHTQEFPPSWKWMLSLTQSSRSKLWRGKSNTFGNVQLKHVAFNITFLENIIIIMAFICFFWGWGVMDNLPPWCSPSFCP